MLKRKLDKLKTVKEKVMMLMLDPGLLLLARLSTQGPTAQGPIWLSGKIVEI